MAQEKYILSLDQGTTSSRAILYDQEARVVSSAQREFPQYYPETGWVEHDPVEIWSSQSAVTAEAMSRVGIGADQIAGVGICNQRETVVVWEKATGYPVHRAIVWQDRRTAQLCRELAADGLERIFAEKTGLRLDPYFSGTKLTWLLDHVDGLRERAERGEVLFGTIDTWLLWRLTEGVVHSTDVSNASRTLLFNLHTQDWDDELLALLRIPRAMLPRVAGNSEVYGEVTSNHFPSGVPIAGSAGDQHAALFGQNCLRPGLAKNTYGTGCFLLMNVGAEPIPSQHNLLSTVAWRIGDHTEYALEGSIFIAGAVVQWLRDELQIIRTAEECSELAATTDNGGVYLVPAFVGMGAPHWDPYARGSIQGLTRGANRAHLCRAAIESIAFQSVDLSRSMRADSGMEIEELRVDGGAAASDPLLQFQADLLRVPVARPRNIETTALGAAFLAGLGVGFWKDRDSLSSIWELDRTFEPQLPEADVAQLRHNWDRAVERSKHWADE